MVKNLSVVVGLNEKLGKYSVINDNTRGGKLVLLLFRDVSQFKCCDEKSSIQAF